MSKQPKAIRLADKLQYQVEFGSYNWSNAETLILEATDELRRLYAESEKLKSLCRRSLQALWEEDFPSLRDELRQALGDISD